MATEQLHSTKSYKTLQLWIGTTDNGKDNAIYCGSLLDTVPINFNSAYNPGVWGDIFAGIGKVIDGVSEGLCKGSGEAASKFKAGVSVGVDNIAEINGISFNTGKEGYGFWGRRYYSGSTEPNGLTFKTRLTQAEAVQFFKRILPYYMPTQLGTSQAEQRQLETVANSIGDLYNPYGWMWPDVDSQGKTTMPRNMLTMKTLIQSTMKSVYQGPEGGDFISSFKKENVNVSIQDRVAIDLWWLIAPKVEQEALKNSLKTTGGRESVNSAGQLQQNNSVDYNFRDLPWATNTPEAVSGALSGAGNATLGVIANTLSTTAYLHATVQGFYGDILSAFLKTFLPLMAVKEPSLIPYHRIRIVYDGADVTQRWVKLSKPYDGGGGAINRMNGQNYCVETINMDPSTDLSKDGVPLYVDLNMQLSPTLKSVAAAYRDDLGHATTSESVDEVINHFIKAVETQQNAIERYSTMVSTGNVGSDSGLIDIKDGNITRTDSQPKVDIPGYTTGSNRESFNAEFNKPKPASFTPPPLLPSSSTKLGTKTFTDPSNLDFYGFTK